MIDTRQIRRAMKQRIEMDRLWGITSVPVSLHAQRGLIRAGTSDRVPHVSDSVARTNPGIVVDPAVAAAKAQRLRVLDDEQVKLCTKCELCRTRTRTVFGQGDPCARLVFVGEAPGYDEDQQGLAFVGRAGQLLTRMILAMGLTREQVFICNVLKCRPPGNREPSADEILACNSYLQEQLTVIQPEVIVALGSPAAKTLLNTAAAIGKLRGRFHEYDPSGLIGSGAPIPTMPTYHPAYLLRNPEEKRKVWEDLQMVMDVLGLPLPNHPRG